MNPIGFIGPQYSSDKLSCEWWVIYQRYKEVADNNGKTGMYPCILSVAFPHIIIAAQLVRVLESIASPWLTNTTLNMTPVKFFPIICVSRSRMVYKYFEAMHEIAVNFKSVSHIPTITESEKGYECSYL